MNVLSDFMVRVGEQFPEEIENEELNSLLTTIRNQSHEIEELNKEVDMLRNNIIKLDADEAKVVEEESHKSTDEAAPAPKKAPAKKAEPKKAPAKKATAAKKTAKK